MTSTEKHPVTIHILPQGIQTIAPKGTLLSEILQKAGIALDTQCGGQGTCGRCIVHLLQGQCDLSNTQGVVEKHPDKDFILSCQAFVIEDIVVRVKENDKQADDESLDSQKLPDMPVPLPAHLTPLSCTRSIPLTPHRHPVANYGLACDVGTTTVVLSLLDLYSGQIVETVSAYNNQIKCGADVITRIIYSHKSGHLQELQQLVLGTIRHLIDKISNNKNMQAEEITAMVFSGNTTMMHLLLGFDPRHIREEPDTPPFKSMPSLTAGDLALPIHPKAPLFFSPAVGSYVGGDITCGVLVTHLLPKENGIRLFIDIGTNGELVVMGDDWAVGCACSAGPAFEGVGIQCGMRATYGAIHTISIKKDADSLQYLTIGNQLPRGLCGSGLIDLVAGLFSRHIINRDGKFIETTAMQRIKRHHRKAHFVVVDAQDAVFGKEIIITEHDIANLIRAKAAIFSAISLILKKLDLDVTRIEKIYIAGAFGSSLHITKAIEIGLFPDLPPERFQYLGNTSLYGAVLALLSSEHRKELNDIAQSMTYIDLSSETGYMDEYMAALFLPHTDQTLFPNYSQSFAKTDGKN
jgi:uncharacterized 2Fe-2S/4Fe-4S cluster protein (DUF4445 family)